MTDERDMNAIDATAAQSAERAALQSSAAACAGPSEAGEGLHVHADDTAHSHGAGQAHHVHAEDGAVLHTHVHTHADGTVHNHFH